MPSYSTQNFVRTRNLCSLRKKFNFFSRNKISSFLFILLVTAFLESKSQIDYLKLPLYPGSGGMAPGIGRVTGNNITISGYRFTNKGGTNNGHCLWVTGTNIIIENNFFDESEGLAIYVNTGSNITIRNNFSANNNWGFLIQRTTGNVKIYNNQFLNMIWDRQNQGCCRGQLIFFDGCSGAGNEVINNRSENFIGESYNEDLVNTFGSGGTVASPMVIKDNIFRGGGPSLTSGGIIGGDLGSQNLDIRDNKLVNPGWYGFQFVSGQNLKFTNNQVYSDQFPWSRIGFLIYRINGYPPCNNITVGPSNWSNVTNQLGQQMNFESNGTCGPVTPPSTGQTLASMNVPAHLLTFVTEDQIWQLRARKVKYDRLVANGLAYGGYDLSRPDANAGPDQNISSSSVVLSSLSVAASGNTLSGYRWVRDSGPGTATISSPTSQTTTTTGLSNGVHVFRLEVTQQNRGGANVKSQDADWVTVTVNNGGPAPNQAPAANAGSDINLTLPTIIANLNGSAIDPDGTIASYSWSRVSGPTIFAITNITSAITTVTGLVQGTYVFRLTATDDDGATATDDVTVTVNGLPIPNQPPVANGGADVVLTMPANYTILNASGSTDPDGTIASYSWSNVSGPASFTIDNANSVLCGFGSLVQGTYVFRLTVTDDDGGTDTDDVTITVNSVPQPPVANAGSNITLTLPVNSTTLTGNGSDPDGIITGYAWSRVSGPTTFTFGSANAASTTLSNLLQGTYTFRLTVTDNSGATATDDVTVTVNAAPNQAPTANAGNNIVLTLLTNSTTLTGSGSDPDGTIASYAWSRVSGPTTFTFGSANAASTTLNNLVQGTYTFRLTVTDNSGATATDDVTVTVNAAPNQAPTANVGNNIVLTLPTNSTTLTGSGTDADGTIAGYAWSRVSGPTTFTFGNANAASTALSNLVQGTYTFRLTVTDNSGATATDDVTVTVNAAPNQAPAANAGNNITLTLPVNSTTLTGSGSDPDGTIASYAWSRVSGPTTFTLGSANAASTTLSNLVQGTYTFRLTVTDNSGATATDDVTVIVNAATNQAPIANAGSNIVLTLPTNSTTLTGSGSDPDGTIASYAWSRVSGPTTFTLGNANTASTTLSNLVQGTYTFRLTVTDNSGATDVDNMTVTVNAAPVSNQAPIANAGNNIVISLPTNAITLNGNSSTDPDGTIASYVWTRVSGPTTFILANANAATTTLSNLVQGTYTFRLTVTDNSGATDSDNMTVTVNTAPNQIPAANAGNNIVITLPVNSTTLNGSGSDLDGTISTYRWSRVTGPTTFAFANANAAVTALSNLVQGTYTFRLTVTDNGGATATDDVTVTVNPALIPNQAPTARAGNDIVITLPTNFATLNGNTSSDADGTIVSYAWSRVSGPTIFTFTSAGSTATGLNNLVQGTYVFRLTVTDDDGSTDTDNITVTVNAEPNQVPTVNAGNDIVLTLPTNSTTLTGSGADADGTVANYSWNRLSGPSTFTISSANTAVTTLSNLVQGIYVFRLTVTDNKGATATDNVTITVNAAPPGPNQPPVADAGPNQAIALPSTSTTLYGNASFDPDGTISSYRWQQMSGPGTSTLSSSTAAIINLSDLQEGTYTFRLIVRDNRNAADTATVDITVLNNFRLYGPVAVYPNPANDFINVILNNDSSGIVQFNIYDMQGRKVIPTTEVDKPRGFFTAKLNVSQLRAGTYTLEAILNKYKKMVSKFVKQ